jgi:release factor glutamine methyltransferase
MSRHDWFTREERAQFWDDDISLFEAAHARLEAEREQLPDKPEETTLATVRALWHLASGVRVSARRAAREPLRSLDQPQRSTFVSLVARRLDGVPLPHLTGRQCFMNLEMLAGPGALIPRAETELLARAAIDLTSRLSPDAPLLVIDVCTGAGNVALAIAHASPDACVGAADLSPEAVALARENVAHLGMAGRVSVQQGDLLAPFDTRQHVGRADLITCNPPYISTRRVSVMPKETAKHEPALAFDGGPLGLRVLQRFIREAPRYLKPGGWMAFEVGLGQGEPMLKRMESTGAFESVESVRDAAGDVRVIMARQGAAA